MKELEKAFYEYIEEVKKLDTKAKREELLNSIKEIIVAYSALAKTEGINLNPLKSQEILDLKAGSESEDDFLEAAITYLEISKNLMGEYLNIKLD
jgi:hypothetical protein